MRTGRLIVLSGLASVILAACGVTRQVALPPDAAGAAASAAARLDPRESGTLGETVTTGRSAPSMPARAMAAVGAWSEPFAWPLIGERALLTGSGEVYSEGLSVRGRSADLWSPAEGAHRMPVRLPDAVRAAAPYSTSITLRDGARYVQGGATQPMLIDASGQRRTLDGLPPGALPGLQPRVFLGPDGRIYSIADDSVYRVDPQGGGNLAHTGAFLPVRHGWSAPAVLSGGEMLLIGGGPAREAVGDVSIVDLRTTAPQVSRGPGLHRARHWHNATVLADGRVLVSGGSGLYNTAQGDPLPAELWDPRTRSWTLAPAPARSRLFNSSALLLPDATVLTLGGGAPGPVSHLDAEIYVPPYLFGADGKPAKRPRIIDAPAQTSPGQRLAFSLADGVRPARVTMVRAGDVARSFDSGQRFVDLPVRADGSRWQITLPREAAEVPPGDWMLFAFDESGVPSIAAMVAVTPPSRQMPRDRVQVAAQDTGAVLFREFVGGRWGAWHELGGALAGAPRAVAAADGTWMTVIGRTRTGDVAIRQRSGDRWHDWRTLGVATGMVGEPSLTVHDAVPWLAWLDAGGTVKVARIDPQDASASAAMDLGRGLATAPVIVGGGDGRLYLVGQSTDRGVRFRMFDGVRWAGWQLHESGYSAGPLLASTKDDGIQVFAQSANRRLRTSAVDDGHGSPWIDLGKPVAGPVAVVSADAGEVMVGVGADGSTWSRLLSVSGTEREIQLDRRASEVVSLVSAPDSGVVVVLRTPAGDLVAGHLDVAGGRWTGWEPVAVGAPVQRYSIGGGAARS